MGLDMSGDISRLKKAIKEHADDVADAADKALSRKTNEIANEAQRRAPHRTGTLERSRKVEKVAEHHYRILFTVHYAIYVHEREELDFHNGEARYLAKAIDTARPTFKEDIANYTNRYL